MGVVSPHPQAMDVTARAGVLLRSALSGQCRGWSTAGPIPWASGWGQAGPAPVSDLVVLQCNALFEQLAEFRAAAVRSSAGSQLKRGLNLLRGKPFVDFEGCTTTALRRDLGCRLVEELDLPAAQSRLGSVQLDGLCSGLRANYREGSGAAAGLPAAALRVHRAGPGVADHAGACGLA